MRIENFDFFGSHKFFNLNGKHIIKSFEGGLYSIFIVILTSIATWIIGNDIIYRKRPNTYQEDLYLANHDAIIWDVYTLPISFAIQDTDGINMNFENYIQTSLNLLKYKTNSSGVLEKVSKENIKFKKCEYINFPSINKADFDSLGLNYTYCRDNINQTLKGYWSEEDFSYLSYEVSRCNNITMNNTCKTIPEIEEFLVKNGANLQLYYQDDVKVLTNFSHPLKKRMNTPFHYIDTDKIKYLVYFLNKNFIESDTGYIFERIATVSYTSLTNYFQDSYRFDSSLGTYLLVEFYSSNVSNKAVRRYVKVTDIISDIGGLFVFITLLSFIFSEYYSDIRFKIILLDHFFKSNASNLNENASRVNSGIMLNNFVKKNDQDNIIRMCKSESFSNKGKNFYKSDNNIITKSINKTYINFNCFERIYILIIKIFSIKKVKSKKFKDFIDDEIHFNKYLDIVSIVNFMIRNQNLSSQVKELENS
jgi:hypothetical protein